MKGVADSKTGLGFKDNGKELRAGMQDIMIQDRRMEFLVLKIIGVDMKNILWILNSNIY